jgi:hypothetical protein
VIRYALVCEDEHEFEAWFSNSDAYDKQVRRKQVECPQCGVTRVRKQIIAPAVHSSSSSRHAASSYDAPPATPEEAIERFAAHLRKHIAETHEYVGDRFADQARAMHEGEMENRPVWGEVTPDVARELMEEGVPAAPLPEPFAPPKPRKRKSLN